ncbi:hypothetical protein ACHAXH_002671, partial [Discostella pseudostelligera]
ATSHQPYYALSYTSNFKDTTTTTTTDHRQNPRCTLRSVIGGIVAADTTVRQLHRARFCETLCNGLMARS